MEHQRAGLPSRPVAIPPPSRLHGDGLVARSIRFALTVMGPIGIGMMLGPASWLIYALVTCILGYALDTGGRALPRLGWIAGAGGVVLAGATLGTLVAGHQALVILGFAVVGVVYALVESVHLTAATAARFLCLALAIGALYVPVAAIDIAVVGCSVLYVWLVSLLWDVAIGGERPSAAPCLAEIAATLRSTSRERWIFAGAVAITVPLAYLTSIELGLRRPYWTLLAIVIVLRADAMSSRRLMLEMLLGTLLGIAFALAYGHFFPSHWMLLSAMVAAAVIRWPAQQLHGALGMAALTAFIMLLLELVAGSPGQATLDIEARFVDIAVGCGFVVVALALDRIGQRLLR